VWKCPFLSRVKDNGKVLFTNFHIVLANPAKYTNKLDKRILQSKTEQVFWEEVQDYKYGCGIPFIKFDFVRASQGVKIARLVKF